MVMKVEKMIENAWNTMEGDTDKAAKVMMTAGAGIVIADLSYRLANTRVTVKLPEISPSALFQGGKNFLFGNFKDWLSGMQKFLAGLTPDFIVKSNGLWDFKWTCAALGVFAAGCALLVADHPEWVSEAIDTAQKIAGEVKDFTKQMMLEYTKAGELPSLGDMADLMEASGTVVEGAGEVVPG